MSLFDWTNMFNKDDLDKQELDNQENAQLKKEEDDKAALEAAPKVPDFSKIENPKVREYMQQKYAADQSVKDAKDMRDIGAYGEMAGKFFDGMSSPTNVRIENRMRDLGKKPERVVGHASKYDGSLGNKLIEQGVKDAEGDAAKVKSDFNDNAQMDQYSRSEDDYDDENDANSEQSKQYQALANKFVPGGNYDGLSAAKIKKMIPPLQKAYEIDMKNKENVQSGSWSSTGQVDAEGNLILMDKNGNIKKGPQTGKKPGSAANEFKELPQDSQEVVKDLSKKNASKIAIKNQIDSTMVNWDTLTDDQKVAKGRQLIKTLNSVEGADAVGAEESKRLGGKLEFALGNLTNSNPTQFGRDLAGFKDQAAEVSASIGRAVRANQDVIDKNYKHSGAGKGWDGGSSSGGGGRVGTTFDKLPN